MTWGRLSQQREQVGHGHARVAGAHEFGHALGVDAPGDGLELAGVGERHAVHLHGVEFLGHDVERHPVIGVAQARQRVEQLDRLPESQHARRQVPVEGAVVIVQLHVEQAAGPCQQRCRLRGPLTRRQRMADVQRDAEVGRAHHLHE